VECELLSGFPKQKKKKKIVWQPCPTGCLSVCLSLRPYSVHLKQREMTIFPQHFRFNFCAHHTEVQEAADQQEDPLDDLGARCAPHLHSDLLFFLNTLCKYKLSAKGISLGNSQYATYLFHKHICVSFFYVSLKCLHFKYSYLLAISKFQTS